MFTAYSSRLARFGGACLAFGGEDGMTDVAGRVPDSAGLELRQDWSKRTLDVTICLISLIVVAPLLALLCCLVSWTSPGPALFRQERLRLGKRPFPMPQPRTVGARKHAP